jgi:hypothetical protein
LFDTACCGNEEPAVFRAPAAAAGVVAGPREWESLGIGGIYRQERRDGCNGCVSSLLFAVEERGRRRDGGKRSPMRNTESHMYIPYPYVRASMYKEVSVFQPASQPETESRSLKSKTATSPDVLNQPTNHPTIYRASSIRSASRTMSDPTLPSRLGTALISYDYAGPSSLLLLLLLPRSSTITIIISDPQLMYPSLVMATNPALCTSLLRRCPAVVEVCRVVREVRDIPISGPAHPAPPRPIRGHPHMDVRIGPNARTAKSQKQKPK